MLIRHPRSCCFTCRRYTRPALVAILAFLLIDSALADVSATDPGPYLEAVKGLSAPNMQGRGDGTKSPTSAAHYIRQRSKSLVLQPDGTNGQFQPLTVMALADRVDDIVKQANTASNKPRHCSIERGAVTYPDSLKGSGIQGSVLLEVIVSSEGCTEDVKVIRKLHPVLDKLAIEAVRSWKFTPATKDGHSVAVIVQLSVNFRDPGNAQH